MGFYVTLTNSSAILPKEHQEQAYKILCDLNNRNDLKSGGGNPRPDNLPEDKPHEYTWFSWMPWNYHETCKNVQEIFEELGFDIAEDLNDNISFLNYDSKTGEEGDFFEAIAHLMTGHMDWCGEDDSHWRWEFSPSGLELKWGEIVYV